jgi:predicted lipoprotein with Yx(FWY)xxD motif
MRFTFLRPGGPRHMSWAARAAVAAVLVSGSTAATAGIAAAQSHSGSVAPGTSAIVVKEAFRTGFGKILVVPGTGRALYFNPSGCSASCQSIWPPHLMPKGTTTPQGAPCLGTVKLGTRLQVTYNKQALYTFTGDSGHSVNGNGVGGFSVAKVLKTCT